MRILFVDDEPNVLSGLRRMLRTKRNEWEMAFTENGGEALTMLGDNPFDVVVSDMRMPEMDGVTLLSQIRVDHPRVVRIALSGQTDAHMIYRCVDHAHQYLAKPCDAQSLTDSVDRAFALRDIMDDANLAGVMANLSSLPSMPEQYRQIMEELQKEDPSLNRIGEIIETDIAMTAKILQLVNSAFFGLARHVASPKQAAMYLGVDVLRSLVVSTGVFSQFESDAHEALNLEALWSRSTRMGGVAKAIASAESDDKILADYAFMAGMMADIGKIIFATSEPEKTATVYALQESESISDVDAELQTFGFSHMEVGAYLVGLWGLPNPIVEAIAFHHRPQACPGTGFTPLTAVHVANALTLPDPEAALAQLDHDYLAALSLTDRIEHWQSLATGDADD